MKTRDQIVNVQDQICSLDYYPEMEITQVGYHVVYYVGSSMRFYGDVYPSLDQAKLAAVRATESYRNVNILRVTSYIAKLC